MCGTIFLITRYFTAKIYFHVCDASLHGFIKRSGRISDHKIAQNTSFQKIDFAKYPVVIDLFKHKSKEVRCSKINLKIRYNILGTSGRF